MKSLFFSILLILTAIVGLFINGYIIIAIILTKQMKSVNHILLLHLSTIDILLGVIFLAFFVTRINGTELQSSETSCLFYGFFLTFLQSLAVWTVCALNYDRFYIIAVPLHYNRIFTSKKVLIAMGLLWTISIFLNTSPFFLNIPYTFIPRLGICEPHATSSSKILWYTIIYTTITLLLPAIFVIICNVKIFIIARYHRHRIASAIYQVAISAQVAITHQKNPFFGKMATPPSASKFDSSLYVIFQFVLSFIVLYVPYYCVIILEVISDKKYLNSNFYTISSSLILLTSPANGYLYGLKSKSLIQILKNYWRKKRNTHDLNQEIHARTPSTCGSRRPSFLIKPENVIDVNKMIKSPFHNQNSPSTNTLQVPSNNNQGVSIVTEDEIYHKLKSGRKTSTCHFLQNIFGRNEPDKPPTKYIPLTCNLKKIEKSPKIVLNSLDTCLNKEESSTSFKYLLDEDQQNEDSDKETENEYENLTAHNSSLKII